VNKKTQQFQSPSPILQLPQIFSPIPSARSTQHKHSIAIVQFHYARKHARFPVRSQSAATQHGRARSAAPGQVRFVRSSRTILAPSWRRHSALCSGSASTATQRRVRSAAPKQIGSGRSGHVQLRQGKVRSGRSAGSVTDARYASNDAAGQESSAIGSVASQDGESGSSRQEGSGPITC
jgi:hypothetical protein